MSEESFKAFMNMEKAMHDKFMKAVREIRESVENEVVLDEANLIVIKHERKI